MLLLNVINYIKTKIHRTITTKVDTCYKQKHTQNNSNDPLTAFPKKIPTYYNPMKRIFISHLLNTLIFETYFLLLWMDL